jgi:thiamine biosynthesis lipoprotein
VTSTRPAAGSAPTPTSPGPTAGPAAGSRSTRSWPRRSRSRWRRPTAPTGWSTRSSRHAPGRGGGTGSPVALGYDRDLRLVREAPAPTGDPVPPPRPGAWRELRVDPAGAVRVPEGTALDLGATGKAFAADLVATAFEQHLAGAALVSVGGDLRVAGPDGDPWRVAVSEHPGEPAAVSVLVRSGGLATSTTQVRRWTSGGVVRHHLLEPRTGRPAEGRWRTATVTAATCTHANTAATAALVGGRQPELPARLVDREGVVHVAGGWPTERNAA